MVQRADLDFLADLFFGEASSRFSTLIGISVRERVFILRAVFDLFICATLPSTPRWPTHYPDEVEVSTRTRASCALQAGFGFWQTGVSQCTYALNTAR